MTEIQFKDVPAAMQQARKLLMEFLEKTENLKSFSLRNAFYEPLNGRCEIIQNIEVSVRGYKGVQTKIASLSKQKKRQEAGKLFQIISELSSVINSIRMDGSRLSNLQKPNYPFEEKGQLEYIYYLAADIMWKAGIRWELPEKIFVTAQNIRDESNYTLVEKFLSSKYKELKEKSGEETELTKDFKTCMENYLRVLGEHFKAGGDYFLLKDYVTTHGNVLNKALHLLEDCSNAISNYASSLCSG